MTNRVATENLGVPGACEIVEENMLETRTSLGWTLVAIMQEDGYDTVTGEYNQQSCCHEMHYPAVTRTKFVVRQPEDETIRSMEYRITQTEAGQDEAESKQHEAELKLEQVEKERDRAQAEIERLGMVEIRLHERINELRQEASEARVAGRTDRESLAKIKAAIGEINLREILEGKVD